MNNYIKLLPFLFVLALAAGCSKDGPAECVDCSDDVVIEVQTSGGDGTRTWMGESEGGVFPVYWSDADKISVNGVTSTALSVQPEEKLTSAAFQVRNVEAPFNVLYPAENAVEFNEADGQYILEIPSVQSYVPGSFACGSAVLYGTSKSEDEPVKLKNLCGAIKVTLQDESAVINSLLLTSRGDARIAGRFSLNIADGTLTPLEGEGGLNVTVQFPEDGVTLSPSGTSFIITIPKGSYPDGFSIKFVDSSKHILRNYWLRSATGAPAGVEVKAGEIVTFAASAYDPDAREICSASDWEEFAAAYNSGVWQSDWLGKDGSIKISEDFSAASLTAIENFTDILDAQGHTLTQTSGTHPLFKNLSGTVRNLILAGDMTPSDPSVVGATVFTSILSPGALLESCTNRMNINSTSSKKTVAGAFARTMNGGEIKDCVNEGKIYINVDINGADQPVSAGSFVGTVMDLASTASILNCINNGSLKVIFTKNASAARKPVNAGYGGIVGTVLSGDADNFLTIENCVNNADVSSAYSVSPTSSSTLLSGTGGIVGVIVEFASNGYTMWWAPKHQPSSVESEDCVYAVLKNCTNNGKVSNDLVSSCSSDDPFKCFVGGISGVVNGLQQLHVVVDGCKNYGSVIGCENKYTRSSLGCAAGGLAGLVAYADFTDCVVKCSQVGSKAKGNYSTAGAIAYVVASFKLNDCRIFADLYHVRVTTYTDMNYAMGFNMSTKFASQGGLYKTFVKIDDSEVTGNKFGGTVTYNTTTVEYSKSDTFKFDKTETLSSSTASNYAVSASFYVDAEGLGVADKVTFDNNTWWDGKE